MCLFSFPPSQISGYNHPSLPTGTTKTCPVCPLLGNCIEKTCPPAQDSCLLSQLQLGGGWAGRGGGWGRVAGRAAFPRKSRGSCWNSRSPPPKAERRLLKPTALLASHCFPLCRLTRKGDCTQGPDPTPAQRHGNRPQAPCGKDFGILAFSGRARRHSGKSPEGVPRGTG